MSRRRQATANDTGQERAEKSRADRASGEPKRETESFELDQIGIESHEFGSDRHERVGRVGVDRALFVHPEGVQERHETAQTREPGEDLKEAEEPEGTLKAELAETREKHEREEREQAEDDGRGERHRVDEMQVIVEIVGLLNVVGERLRQVLERLFGN